MALAVANRCILVYPERLCSNNLKMTDKNNKNKQTGDETSLLTLYINIVNITYATDRK